MVMLAQPGLEEFVGQVVSSNNAHNLEGVGGRREREGKKASEFVKRESKKKQQQQNRQRGWLF